MKDLEQHIEDLQSILSLYVPTIRFPPCNYSYQHLSDTLQRGEKLEEELESINSEYKAYKKSIRTYKEIACIIASGITAGGVLLFLYQALCRCILQGGLL